MFFQRFSQCELAIITKCAIEKFQIQALAQQINEMSSGFHVYK
jgi:hypothetical protein